MCMLVGHAVFSFVKSPKLPKTKVPCSFILKFDTQWSPVSFPLILRCVQMAYVSRLQVSTEPHCLCFQLLEHCRAVKPYVMHGGMGLKFVLTTLSPAYLQFLKHHLRLCKNMNLFVWLTPASNFEGGRPLRTKDKTMSIAASYDRIFIPEISELFRGSWTHEHVDSWTLRRAEAVWVKYRWKVTSWATKYQNEFRSRISGMRSLPLNIL